ncbi:MAG: type II toxin-antitoxin system VapC family toxin [Spirochaetota bacterium]
MPSMLVDAGPLIALFDRDDDFHKPALAFVRDNTATLVSTWPVATEVSHMLDFDVRAQLGFLRWVDRGGLSLFEVEKHHLQEIVTLMERYADRPMDLADATLVLAADVLHVYEVVSIDRDFDVYRTHGGKHVRNIFPR